MNIYRDSERENTFTAKIKVRKTKEHNLIDSYHISLLSYTNILKS